MFPTLKAGFLAVAASFLFLFPLSTGTTPCGISETESIIIRDKDGSSASILKEMGDTFYLECTIGGASSRNVPDPWYLVNGDVVMNSSRVFVSVNRLYFSPFHVSDQGQYQCYCREDTTQRSPEIIIYATPPKTDTPPLPLIAMTGDNVTFGCPLQFIKYSDIPLSYKVSWDISNNSVIVMDSTPRIPGVVFDRQTLNLTILDLAKAESYTCRITSGGSINFDATIASDPVRILLLEPRRISVSLSPSIVVSGEQVSITCSPDGPLYNEQYSIQVANEGQTVATYTNRQALHRVSSSSLNVTCVATQVSNATADTKMLRNKATGTVCVVDTPQLSREIPTSMDGCIQRLLVSYKQNCEPMELWYIVTVNQNESCPANLNGRQAEVHEHREFDVDLTGLPLDGTRVDLYVRAWRRYGGVDGKCSPAVKLQRADPKCFNNNSTENSPAIIAGSIAGIIIFCLCLLVLLGICVCYFCCRNFKPKSGEYSMDRERRENDRLREQNRLTALRERERSIADGEEKQSIADGEEKQ
jgi:hypothetical protein